MHRNQSRLRLLSSTASRMLSLPANREVEMILDQLNRLDLKQQQLKDRRGMLTMLQDFRDNSDGPTSNGGGKEDQMQSELAEIDKELQDLMMQEEELQRRKDRILYPKSEQEAEARISSMGGVHVLPSLSILPPPSVPAPQVILEVENLPTHPSPTQCPSCKQFITTETHPAVGSLNWLMCVTCVVVGGVAGCCFLPFCLDSYKDVVHRCPKCQTLLHRNKRL